MQIGAIHTVGAIAQFLGREVVGDASLVVTGINIIHCAQAGDLIFVDHPSYYEKAIQSAASFLLINQTIDFPDGKALILSPTPFDDYNKLTRKFAPERLQKSLTGDNTDIADSAYLSPNCFIGHDVFIGEHAIIHAGAYIGNGTIIEENVIVGPNAVIGYNAFYYQKQTAGYERLHTCGFVVLEKNVEIGALTTIDAGVSAITRIGEGTKIDNHVHIGHDTVVGHNCLIGASVHVAGCVSIQNDVVLAGSVSCAPFVSIGAGVRVDGHSYIAQDLKAATRYVGNPLVEQALVSDTNTSSPNHKV